MHSVRTETVLVTDNDIDSEFIKLIMSNIAEKNKDNLLDFSITKDSQGYILTYKKVQSDGPVIGFLGHYIDLLSGCVVMGPIKSKEFYSFFNLYNLMEKEGGISVDSNFFKVVMERYKIKDISLGELFVEIWKARETSMLSLVGRFLRQTDKDQDSTGMEEWIFRILLRIIRLNERISRIDLGKGFRSGALVMGNSRMAEVLDFFQIFSRLIYQVKKNITLFPSKPRK